MLADTEVGETIKAIVDRLVAAYKPQKIILFGSYAYGTPDRDSDIDLLIIKETDERPIDRRVAVRRLVSDARRGMPFDAIVLTPRELEQRLVVRQGFVEEIIGAGVVLYDA